MDAYAFYSKGAFYGKISYNQRNSKGFSVKPKEEQ